MKIKNIIILLSIFIIPLIIIISCIKLLYIEKWYNDCMLEYNKQNWYIYKIDDFKYHIDNKKQNHLELIWYSKWCYMYGDNKYSLIFLFNSIYCSVTRFI